MMKKRSSPPGPNPNHPSPSTSSSSSSCVLDDHPSSDQPLKQNTRAQRARKRPIPRQCHQKKKKNNNKLINSTTTNSDTNTTNSNGRSSIYRGVTRHRWTGRFEAHLWDKSSYNSIQNKKGKQVYLGAYDSEDDAARTYDLAALKYWGPDTILNFPSENYTKELEEMQNVSKEAYLASLRRRSSGFSRGVSKYRGVAKHHHNGRWEARIGRVFGNKYLYLGTFSSQEEAAKAYDLAAIQHRGRNAVTNFDINNYIPKDELQRDENPTTFVETNQDVVVVMQQDEEQNQEQQEQNQQIVLDTFEETELANAFNESPVLVMDRPGCGSNEPNDDPWSFSLHDDGGGYDPLLVPHILHDEEDGNLLDLLDQKAFEDDIHLIFDGYLEGVDNGGCQLMKEGKMMDKSSFDSSSPSSSSTVSSELF